MKYVRILLISLLIPCFFTVTNASENSKKLTIDIRIEATGKLDWFVEYQFSEPVQEIQFATQSNEFRKSKWQVLIKGAKLKERKGSQYLAFETAIDRLKIKLKADDNRFVRRNYTAVLIFTDESRAIYTGHYLLSNIVTEKGELISARDANTRLTLSAGEYQKVVYKGVEAPLINIPVLDSGEYAYFGTIQSQPSENYIGIIDPGLPEWMAKDLQPFLDKVFAYYRKKFGFPLETKPIAIINFTPTTGKARSDGSRINDQFVVSYIGNGWANTNDDENGDNIRKLISHEVAHLWNSRPININSQPWMHEGGAETFTIKALYALGYKNKQEVIIHYNNALENCINAMNISPIGQFQYNGLGKSIYTCGDLVSLIADLELKKKNENLFSLWRSVLLNKKDVGFKREDFLNAYYKRTDIQTGKNMEALVTATEPNTLQQKMLHMLKNAGIKLNKTKRYPEEMGDQAIKQLMRVNCGTWSYWQKDTNIQTDIMKGCNGFEQQYEVIGLGGFNLFEYGVSAYEYLFNQCSAKERVELNILGSNEKVYVPCNHPIPLGYISASIVDIPL